jgi:hypothetical protein
MLDASWRAMSFLDAQDLALAAAQFDLEQVYRAWSGEEGSILPVVEIALLAALGAIALRWRRKHH